MSNRPDAESLRDLGESTTNVANAWAGATDYLSRGLKAWARQEIGRDRGVAVRAAVAACELVAPTYLTGASSTSGLPPRSYIDGMLAVIRRWIDDPSNKHTELVRSSLDVTRQSHAWQQEQDVAAFWILEAVDHACLAVWSGERSSYIVPLDWATCAARSIACVLHSMLASGVPENQAVDAVTRAVRSVTAA